MSKIAGTMLIGLLLACGVALAAEPAGGQDAAAAKEKQMEKLGGLRGRLMVKIDELYKSIDNNQNGTSVMYARVYELYGQINQAVGKRLQEENATPAEMRNQAAIDNLNKRSQKVNEMWNGPFQKKWNAYNAAIRDLGQTCQYLQQVFGSMANMEMAWNKSGLDMEMIINVFSSIEQRVDDTRTKAKAAIAEFEPTVAEWEAFAKE